MNIPSPQVKFNIGIPQFEIDVDGSLSQTDLSSEVVSFKQLMVPNMKKDT